MNIARVAAVLSGLPNTVGGVTVNRYCASGITRWRWRRTASASARAK